MFLVKSKSLINMFSKTVICPGGGQASPPPDSSKLLELQSTVRSLQEEAEQRERQLQEVSASLEEAGRNQVTLQLEKDEVQAENAELLQNYTRLQASVTELQTRVQEQEEKNLNKAQLDSEIQGLRKGLAGITVFLLMDLLKYLFKRPSGGSPPAN